MSDKRRISQSGVIFLVTVSFFVLVSCQDDQGEDTAQFQNASVFGNGFEDFTPVICKVGDVEISQNDLDLRYEELPRNLKSRFSGNDWEKRFLRYMVDEVLLYKEAVNRKIYLDPEVAQHLISQHRSVLKNALRDRDLVKNLEPTEEQIKTHFERNKENYMRQGTLRARHISCQSKENIFEAYDRLRQGGRQGNFAYVVAEYSTNLESAKQAGDLGWFNRGGFIPALPYGREFSETIWEWEMGLHEPVMIGGEWHVVELVSREYERPLTLEEARGRIVKELTPILQEEVVESFLREAKETTPVEYYGAYQPGDGRSPKEIFEMAWYAKTPEQQIDFYKLLIEDYPKSDLADDALFMIANVYIDRWSDLPFASRYLDRLVKEYPDSELYEQAQYMLDNLGRTDFHKPESIEELQQMTDDN